MSITETIRRNKTARCLWLLKLLAEEPLHYTELAVLFRMSERAIQRDIQTLEEAGVTIERSPRGYHLQGHWSLPL